MNLKKLKLKSVYILLLLVFSCLIIGCGSGSGNSNPGSEDNNPGSEDNNPGSEDDNPGSEDDNPGSENNNPVNDVDIGINPVPLRDWSTSWSFVDRMKHSREWVPFSVGTNEWGDSGVVIPADGNGYPLEVPYDPDGNGPILPQQAKTLVFRDTPYPAGTYTLLFDGTGTVSIDFDATGTFSDSSIPHPFEVNTPSDNGLLLSILTSSASDPIRNIRVIMPGFTGNYDTQIFHPLFLERLGIFKVIRFGGWGNVWGNMTEDWSEVVTPDHFSQAGDSGVSPEHMIQLSNRLGSDPWIGIPHQANDIYVEELAKLIKAKMDTGRKIYIEYANETWNSMMNDAHYVQEQGVALGLSSNNFQAGLFYYARRSAEIFQIFEDVFGGTDRIVRVVGSQAANAWTGEQILKGLNDPSINPTSSRADVLAIGPYFGNSIADDIVENGEVDTITVDEILDRLEDSVYTNTEAWTKDNYAISEEYNVDLIAYEGGPHLAGTGYNMDNTVLSDKITEVSRHSRMKGIMLKMFDVWFDNGGQLFAGYSFIDNPSKYGCFGALEYQDQPISEAPKYSAYYDYISTN